MWGRYPPIDTSPHHKSMNFYHSVCHHIPVDRHFQVSCHHMCIYISSCMVKFGSIAGSTPTVVHVFKKFLLRYMVGDWQIWIHIFVIFFLPYKWKDSTLGGKRLYLSPLSQFIFRQCCINSCLVSNTNLNWLPISLIVLAFHLLTHGWIPNKCFLFCFGYVILIMCLVYWKQHITFIIIPHIMSEKLLISEAWFRKNTCCLGWLTCSWRWQSLRNEVAVSIGMLLSKHHIPEDQNLNIHHWENFGSSSQWC
jgi:hypothetical protein